MKTPVSMISALAVLAVTATSAGAQTAPDQTAQRPLGFSGEVAAGCLLSTPTAPELNNATAVSLAPGSADIVVTQLVGEDGVPIGAVVILALPSICNQAHTLRLNSLGGGLVNPEADGDAAPFRGALPYGVQINWGDVIQTYETGDPALELSVGNAVAGQVTLTIQIPAGGAPLVAGVYSDQLVLELGVTG